MTVRANKPAFNVREKLKELDYSHLPYEKVQPGGVVQMQSSIGSTVVLLMSLKLVRRHINQLFVITIYPKFADSLIRITTNPNTKNNGGSNYHNLVIYRSIDDGPFEYSADSSTSNGLVTYRFSGSSLMYDNVPLDFFDKPNTTGKVQYKVYHRNSGGNYTVRVGENGAYEYMSATEIRQGILEDAE